MATVLELRAWCDRDIFRGMMQAYCGTTARGNIDIAFVDENQSCRAGMRF